MKTDIIEGDWHLEFAEMNNPEANGTEHGVWIRVDPWDGSYWDGDSGSFDSEDGSQPDEWADHTAAMRDIFSSEDIVKGFSVDNPDSDYDDWYNYVPASKAAELGE